MLRIVKEEVQGKLGCFLKRKTSKVVPSLGYFLAWQVLHATRFVLKLQDKHRNSYI